MSYIFSFLAGIITIIIMDSIWLGYIVKGLIIREFGSLIEVLPNGSIKFSISIGLAAWSAIVIGCFIFVVSRATSWNEAMIYGALFGAVSYGIYDLTNLTFIKGYSPIFTLVDIGWGIVLCSVVSVIMFFVYDYFSM